MKSLTENLPVIDRRGFLKASAAAASGVFISMNMGCATSRAVLGADGSFSPNAWLTIRPDGRILFILDRVEMGQGTTTSHVMMLAEELEVDPAQIEVEPAPAHDDFNNTLFFLQTTGGSTSVKSSWTVLRQAGATARETLKSAAAQAWGVPAAEVTADKGVLKHASGKSATYAEMAAVAGKLDIPDEVKLKEPAEWKLIGKEHSRHDVAPKVDGSGVYGMDFKVPGMRYAVVVRCPVFGGKVTSFDAAKTKAHPGVEAVVEIDNGVAVVADSYWTARQASADLVIAWDEGDNKDLSSAKIRETYQKMAEEEGAEARSDGDADEALAGAAKTVDAIYEVPFLAHATMEPMNATAQVTNGPEGKKVKVWVPNQCPDVASTLAAQVAEVDVADVDLRGTLIGGGFGRRLPADYVVEAVGVAQQVAYPVKVVWSREDDTRHDFYRPTTYNVLKGGVDEQGKPVAWKHRVVGQSILSMVMPDWIPEMLPNWTPGVLAAMAGGSIGSAFQNAWVADTTSVEGANEVPYKIDNYQVDLHTAEPWIPVGFWRSVGHSENGFVVESFVDELAHLAGKDPYLFRRDLLEPDSRERGVLEKVAQMSGWEKGPRPGHHFGIAQHKSFESYAANVIEVAWDASARDPRSRLKITRAWAAIDCGRVVNPDVVKAQMEGGLVFGLSMTLKQAITLDKGRVQQSNFHDYGTLRIHETPEIEVGIIASEEEPTGVGEPGVPAVAPALCNAIFAATKKRIRSLPVEPHLDDMA